MDEESLSIQARTHEIDRQLESTRFRLWALKWIASPTFLALVGCLVYFAIDRHVGLTTSVLGGAAGLIVALVTALRGFGELKDETAALEEARRLLIGSGGGPESR